MKPIRTWRIVGETATGAYCFFDPSREIICIRDLTSLEKADRLKSMVAVTHLETETDFPELPLVNALDEVPF